MTNWMTRWLRRQRRRTNGANMTPRMRPEVGELVAPPEAQGQERVGCGWFDSSWELQHGLAVREGPVIDPLGLWTFERQANRRQATRVAAAAP